MKITFFNIWTLRSLIHQIKFNYIISNYQRIKWNKIVFLKSALYIFATSYNFNSL